MAYNIVMFGHKRIPSREGGVEIVVEQLSTEFVNQGHRVTCINRRGHHVSGAEFDQEQVDELHGIRITSVPTIEKKGLSAVSAAFFATLRACFSRCNVVHIHAEGPAAFCWLPRLFFKRVVVTCHGLDWQRPRWVGNFGGRFIRYGEHMAVRHAHAIIVLSRNVQNYFRAVYRRETVYIPNGITRPDPIPAQLISEQYGLEKDSYILALARLTNEKNVHALIRAYKGLKTDKKMVIAGGSSESEDYVKKLHALAGNDPNIIFTGFVQGQMLSELYSNAYIYCLPSKLEGMPLSLLEAMSYGNCCLVSDIPECLEVIEDKALSFSIKEPDSLRQILQKLCDEPETVAQYKKNAASYICKRFSWSDVAAQTLALYHK